jgi:hypothetical protein
MGLIPVRRPHPTRIQGVCHVAGLVMAIALVLTTSVSAETMGKEEFIDTVAKVKACSEAKHLPDEEILDKSSLFPRLRHFAMPLFSEAEKKDFEVIMEIKKKKAITTMGWGCEAALQKLMALPLPPQ